MLQKYNGLSLDIIKNTPPGEIVEENRQAYDMDIPVLAMKLDMSIEEYEQFLSGKIAITQELAEKLSKVFEMPVVFWLNLEKLYRESQKSC